MPQVYENLDVFQNYNQQEDQIYPFPDVMMNNLSLLSPSNSSLDSQMTSSTPSPMSISQSPNHTMSYYTLSNVTGTMLEDRYIKIIEQPVDKFRFRYKSEMMGTHGSLAGANSSNSRKKQAPTVELKNYPGSAVIRCTLVTADPDRRGPHAHRLVRRVGNSDEDDPHEQKVSPEQGFTVSFHGMGIIHTAKKHIKDELVKKKRITALEEAKRKNVNVTSLTIRDEATIKMEAEAAQKWMSLNSVALCFQAFVPNANGVLCPITEPVYSNPINNLKSALTGELKICRIDKTAGSCDGNEEVFMLVEKVGKKNIVIKFFEMDENNVEIWSALGHFTELDVHHQYAIVFRTPPYKDKDITEPKEVFIKLCRPTDGESSDPLQFTYKPNNRIGRKRPRMSCESTELQTPIAINLVQSDEGTSVFNVNNSSEINKLLSEHCTSNEFREYSENLDLEEYINLLPREVNDNEELRLDGSLKKKETASFAETIVKQIRIILQKNDPNGKERILALLKERTVYGDSPLHSALRHGQMNLVKYILMLLAKYPDFKQIVDSQTSSGRTCLHYAVEQNQPAVTKALLLIGADASACDDHGFSPLHKAVKIPEAGHCVDALLEGGSISVETRDDTGWTALHLAAEAGSLHAVKSLVKAGVDVNSTDMSYGRTALHIAVEGGHKEIVEFLLKKTTIDVNKRNFSGNTALHSAVVNTGERAEELCKLLLNHGANPSIPNNNRDSSKELQATTIKDEAISDDEDAQESGQTSFDLASNKPEILQLLSATNTIIKQEIEDVPEESDGTLLDEKAMTLLVPILDESKAWEKIVTSLGYDFLQSSLKTSGPVSPSRMLLNYLDIQAEVSIEKLRTLLVELNETKAVDIIDEMILRRNTSSTK
ncbi:nuclear factor NF-kappa-B p105 subunit isoform X1 [Neodiprion virginianus]|uniref:nuclear factor NF-kappa-B p105 subunit isoform X1 n=2 Tax=Neodiprion virginianus TaxID=2961670 RepID=UPI001EE73524|nr:nuclear factor NF-kappa-B p105 subunit isoform X1 [Neodiprion virginianus]XP_046630061.1 nuclear factor NF-kappa-B p105 subunit isoform X1 [Neodiprion virginianus]